jgi:hypothetical protein
MALYLRFASFYKPERYGFKGVLEKPFSLVKLWELRSGVMEKS